MIDFLVLYAIVIISVIGIVGIPCLLAGTELNDNKLKYTGIFIILLPLITLSVYGGIILLKC